MDPSRELELDVAALFAGEIPDCRPHVALTFVVERQPLVTRDGRPALGEQRQAVVELLGDVRPRARVDHPQSRMDQVAVLGVLYAEQRTVGREPAAQESTLVDAADPNGFG